ncbi:ABC transporter substrate-binding protein [Haploplasma axanthum]|uniref:Maltose-binding periplasmic proteins/domains n=1 Tax=Haploplasma axanthum TaxID=29552 RepID=A0A449BBG5_HAPAX|nr:extracellular solute-binding protein [Haploplasma axanthum]VEU79767.1 Maltose-binding periplasmic proteins/domains [Haploplasma axanthum]
MKKILVLMLLAVAGLGLAACGKKPDDGGGTGGDDNKIDLKGENFVIMVNTASTSDPRLETYEKLFREEKIAKITEVEKKYNVKVVYENYPSNASWGGARERWIVEQSKVGVSPAHVFEVASTSVATLAVNDAILPLDNLIETYGAKGYWPEKLVFGEVLGKHYLYDDSYPMTDDGLYYNSDLIARVLGEERRLEPTKKWLAGEWTWAEFEKLARELKTYLDHTRPEAEGGPQYVLGGRSYNYAYPMIGANGGVLVDSNFGTHLTSEPVLDTLNFLNRLRTTEGMWIDNAPLSNASQPEFTAGNVAFHNGSAWHINASNKWGNAKFKIDYVPWPVGPNIKEDMSNYSITHVYGKSSFAISSSYSKDRIPEGYENRMISDEVIFKIWNDLMYFPAINSETNLIDTTLISDDFYNVRLLPYYWSKDSINAHLEVFNLASPDFFYSVPEAQAHAEGSYMLSVQLAITDGNSRTVMEGIEASLKEILKERFLDKK